MSKDKQTKRKKQSTRGQKSRRESVRATIIGGVAVLFIGLLALGLVGPYPILDRLQSVEYARGLITFLLALGTIAIAVILALAALLGKAGGSGKRFARGKEVLTILIGVLGTIVGFYYGMPSETNGQGLAIATPLLSSNKVSGGEEVTLTSFLSGGEPPYKYSITFKNEKMQRITGLVADGGWLTEKILVPYLKQRSIVGYRITIRDAKASTAVYSSPEKESIIIDEPSTELITTAQAQ